MQNSRLIDSGGGFLIDEKDLEEEQSKEVLYMIIFLFLNILKLTIIFMKVVITETPAPILLPERPHCDECEHPIHDSFLYRSFGFPICDTCRYRVTSLFIALGYLFISAYLFFCFFKIKFRDEEEKHALITRTEARQEYLLKDCDLDLREPVLRFILRKNPHNPRWGDMKLYLRSQVMKKLVAYFYSILRFIVSSD